MTYERVIDPIVKDFGRNNSGLDIDEDVVRYSEEVHMANTGELFQRVLDGLPILVTAWLRQPEGDAFEWRRR